MKPIQLSWTHPLTGQVTTSTLRTLADVEEAFEDARRQAAQELAYPLGVDLDRVDGDLSLVVGLGGTEWFVGYVDEEREFLYAVGDMSATGEMPFFIWGSSCHLSKKYAIPKDIAWEVVRTWIEEGRLSDKIEWTREILD